MTTTMATRLPTKLAATTAALQGLDSCFLVLPYPPSVNALYRAVKGRSILSEKYRDWKAEASTALMLQKPKPIAGQVSVIVEMSPPDKRKRDLDNAGFKAILDLLVSFSIIAADDSSVVREIVARWVEGEPGQCTVIVRKK
jgi:crossover junction endodeoxyribonuclease RusA